MAIQMRRGTYSAFADGSQLNVGEFGVVTTGDTTTSDGTGTYIKSGTGIVHRLLTDDDKGELASLISALTEALTVKEVAVTLDDAFEPYGGTASNTPKLRVSGNVVELSGMVSPSASISSGGDATIGTFPSQYAPKLNQRHIMQGSGSDIWLLAITSGGSITFSRYRSGASYADAGTSQWLPLNATWIKK